MGADRVAGFKDRYPAQATQHLSLSIFMFSVSSDLCHMSALKSCASATVERLIVMSTMGVKSMPQVGTRIALPKVAALINLASPGCILPYSESQSFSPALPPAQRLARKVLCECRTLYSQMHVYVVMLSRAYAGGRISRASLLLVLSLCVRSLLGHTSCETGTDRSADKKNSKLGPLRDGARRINTAAPTT